MSAESIRDRYVGEKARNYETRRSRKAEWRAETAAVERFLEGLPHGATVLDIPVGTGRFADIYRRMGLDVLGIDVSPDMLNIAASRGLETRLGSILDIDAPDGAFDAVVCTRLLNWLTADEMVKAVREVGRVASDRVVLSIRFGEPTAKENSPHRREAFTQVAAIRETIPLDDRGYFMVLL